MPKVKLHKPPVAERNRVVWIEKNQKFIREHSLAYPKPAWTTAHAKWLIIGMIIFGVMLIASFFVKYLPLKIFFTCINVILFSLLVADILTDGIRISKMYKELLERGGKTVDSWNLLLIKRSGAFAHIVILVFAVIVYLYMGLMIAAGIAGKSQFNPVSAVLVMNVLNFHNIFYAVPYGSFPYIFMDIEEGMFFGGALFSYDTLSGIRPTGEGSGFELYYEGEKVAEGNMLPDDMKLLREIIDVRSKYRD